MAAIAGKRVQITKHQPRCKICSSAHVDDIDYLLLLRSLRHPDHNGEIVTFEVVVARVKAAFDVKLTRENVTTHWSKHRDIVFEDEAAETAEQEQTRRMVEEFRHLIEGGVDTVDVDGALRAMFKVGLEDFIGGLESGRTKVTLDQMVKISDALARRNKNEAEGELMRTLGAGIGAAFGGAMLNSGRDRQALDSGGDVIELAAGDVEEIVADDQPPS
jgi:hypothetical protein